MKTKWIILLLPIIILFSACNDLNPTPPDFTSVEIFYSNPLNYEAGVTGVYNALKSCYDDLPILMDGLSDNSIASFTSVNDLQYFANGSLTSNVVNTIANLYQNPYVVIQRSNTLIYYMDKVGSGNLPQSTFDEIKAQARALRAIGYQRLIYLFGDVPFYTEPIDASRALKIPRTSRAQIVDFILKELEESANDIGYAPMGGIYGRLTKQAVLAFRAETMVYEARLGNKTWKQALDVTNMANQAALEAGVSLMYSGNGTDGLANFNAVFDERNNTLTNSEVLLFIRSSTNFSGEFSVNAGKLYMSAHENLAKDFFTKAGLPITDPASGYDETKVFAQRANWDPRLHATLVVPGARFSTGTQWQVFNGKATKPTFLTNYAIRKFTEMYSTFYNVSNKIPFLVTGASNRQLDFPAFRYAELLLLLAEAENQVNGPTTIAYNAIKAIRDRVSMPNVLPGLDKTAFNKEVIHERRIELAFEGKRWVDLVTLGIAADAINAINANAPDEPTRHFITGKSELLPIPKTQTDRNRYLLPNNQGY